MNIMLLLNFSFIGSYALLFLTSSWMALFVALDIPLILRCSQVPEGTVYVILTTHVLLKPLPST